MWDRDFLIEQITRFATSKRGNIAVMFGLLAPVLGLAVAGSVDFISATSQQRAMQNAADIAALNAVREATLKGWSTEIAEAVASHTASANYAHHASESYFTVMTLVDTERREVSVTIQQDHYPYFFARAFPTPQLSVQATATAAGSTNICVIGLDPKREGTVQLEKSSVLSAPDCAVFSNSTSASGLTASGSSKLLSQLTCTAGGYTGGLDNFGSTPLTDCPATPDPLAERPAPSYSTACTERGLLIKGGNKTVTISPGVYCDGMTIMANAEVTLLPGVYVIKDGPLLLSANASLTGRDVGFYFTGAGASFSLESGSTVDIEAGREGPMAGLLFHQDRNSAEADFVLRSNKASNLLGTVYLPNGNFIIDTNSKVADTSAYTAIVARSLTLLRDPHVVLNTDYDRTSVPVPEGLGPQGGDIRLIR